MLILLLISLLNGAEAKEVSIVHPLTDLDSASLVLRLAFDGDKESGCGIDSNEATKLMGVMEARIDSKKRELMKAPYSKGWPTQTELKNCEINCHCGIFSSLFEGLPHLQPEWNTLYQNAQNKAQSQGVNESKKCAKKAEWFCSSQLLKSLRKEAKTLGAGLESPGANY